MLGWRVTGNLPNEPKMMVALAPHTSNWDFVISMAAIMAIGIRVSYLMKKEAFIWPFSLVWQWLGGVPLNRKATADTVEQLAQTYREREKLWLAIAPEGTRQKVTYWRTGFLRIAHLAQVPVLIVGWDYQNKVMNADKLWHPTGDHEKDAAELRNYVGAKFVGKHSSLQ